MFCVAIYSTSFLFGIKITRSPISAVGVRTTRIKDIYRYVSLYVCSDNEFNDCRGESVTVYMNWFQTDVSELT